MGAEDTPPFPPGSFHGRSLHELPCQGEGTRSPRPLSLLRLIRLRRTNLPLTRGRWFMVLAIVPSVRMGMGRM